MALRHVVFAEPDNKAAKFLLADAHEQMGYQAESGPWRAEYLQGAFELRTATSKSRVKRPRSVTFSACSTSSTSGSISSRPERVSELPLEPRRLGQHRVEFARRPGPGPA